MHTAISTDSGKHKTQQESKTGAIKHVKFNVQSTGSCGRFLLEERPLDKITVRDINTDRCGLTRNTFYYHFRIFTIYWDIFFGKKLMPL